MQRAQQQWRAFLAEAPAYPESGFSGRGVVILSGSLPYMVPAWVNLHMLRLTGELQNTHCFQAPQLAICSALSPPGSTCTFFE